MGYREDKPHCWGKMYWILNYEPGKEPQRVICNCEYGSRKCLQLTRENASKKVKLEDKTGNSNL